MVIIYHTSFMAHGGVPMTASKGKLSVRVNTLRRKGTRYEKKGMRLIVATEFFLFLLFAVEMHSQVFRLCVWWDRASRIKGLVLCF